MKDLRQRQCRNLSKEDIADVLEVDIEIVDMLLNLLEEQGIVGPQLHVYCNECSAENVISCDGFYEVPIICHKCGKQIDITDAGLGGIKRYNIDKKGLEEFVRRDYYEVYHNNSKSENKIIDFEPKCKVMESENGSKEERNIVEDDNDTIRKQLDEIEDRHKEEDFISCITKLGICILLIVILTCVCLYTIIDMFILKDQNPSIYVFFVNAIEDSAVEKYMTEIVASFFSALVVFVTALYRVIIKRIILYFKRLKELVK